jgi:hypothetical protein
MVYRNKIVDLHKLACVVIDTMENEGNYFGLDIYYPFGSRDYHLDIANIIGMHGHLETFPPKLDLDQINYCSQLYDEVLPYIKQTWSAHCVSRFTE